MKRALLAFALLSTFALGGCAFAPFPDGRGGVVGLPLGDDSGTPAGLGSAIGTAASFFGIPGGPVIGTLAAGLLGAVGYGAKKRGDALAAKSAHEAENRGWNEREQHQERIDREYVEALHTPAPGLDRPRAVVGGSGSAAGVGGPVVAVA